MKWERFIVFDHEKNGHSKKNMSKTKNSKIPLTYFSKKVKNYVCQISGWYLLKPGIYKRFYEKKLWPKNWFLAKKGGKWPKIDNFLRYNHRRKFRFFGLLAMIKFSKFNFSVGNQFYVKNNRCVFLELPKKLFWLAVREKRGQNFLSKLAFYIRGSLRR